MPPFVPVPGLLTFPRRACACRRASSRWDPVSPAPQDPPTSGSPTRRNSPTRTVRWLRPALAFAVSALTVPAAPPRQVPLDPLKQLVLDTRVIAQAENARLVLGTPAKDPRNPLLPADRPWENATNNLYPNVLWDAQEQVFKLWYKDVLADKDVIVQMDRPSTVHDVGWYLLYATSKDGVTWQKPALGLHRFAGSDATNIVARDTPNTGVFKDPHDPDPARRYKMVYDVGLGKLRTRVSADGIHWGEPREVNGFSPQHGDTHNNAFWDTRLGKYVWFTKLYLGERLVARFESDDFVNWRNTGMVLRSTVEEGRNSQTYCLPVFPYANLYLGYVMMYNVGKGRTVDCELAWSHDGVRWQRVAPGTPFLPRGAAGTYDSQCIYAQSGPATEQDGQLQIYYGGSDFPHTGWKRHCLLSLARLRVDGFAGYEPVAADRTAVLTSSRLRLASDRLAVSVDAARGRLDLEVLDERNQSLGRARPVTGDVTDHPIDLDLRPWRGRTVRLRFTLTGARLYAFRGATLDETMLPETPPAPVPRVAAKPEPRRIGFDRDVEGWKGTDRIEHHSAGGAFGGYVTAHRGKALNPILTSVADAKVSPLTGDWPQLLGGDSATLTWRAQTRQAGTLRLDLFAQEAQWTYETGQTGPGGWQSHQVTLRYDWTDAQAEAAGWKRAQNAFSWRETLRHIGRLALAFAPAEPAVEQSLDLDELEVRGR